MFISKFVKIVFLLILLHLFLSVLTPLAAEDEKLPLPQFCSLEWQDEKLYGRNEAQYYLCLGVRSYNEQSYQSAYKFFKTSNEVDIFEVPNYESMPYMALAKHKLGDHVRSKMLIDESWLSLMLDIGFITCDKDTDFLITESEKVKRIDKSSVRLVGRKMCSSLYENYYGSGTMADVQRLQARVKLYHRASKEITGSWPISKP